MEVFVLGLVVPSVNSLYKGLKYFPDKTFHVKTVYALLENKSLGSIQLTRLNTGKPHCILLNSIHLQST